MTVRNRSTRLIPGNPLASLLRENAREARRPRRRKPAVIEPVEPETNEPEEQ